MIYYTITNTYQNVFVLCTTNTYNQSKNSRMNHRMIFLLKVIVVIAMVNYVVILCTTDRLFSGCLRTTTGERKDHDLHENNILYDIFVYFYCGISPFVLFVIIPFVVFLLFVLTATNGNAQNIIDVSEKYLNKINV